MLIGTSKLSRNVDTACVEEVGIPMIVLMENAVISAMKNMDIDMYNSIQLYVVLEIMEEMVLE